MTWHWGGLSSLFGGRPDSWRWPAGLVGLISLLGAGNAPAAEAPCTWEGAAARYGVNPQILYAIAHHESRLNPGAVHKNNDGTQDIGLMQINSRWLPHLDKFGITTRHLLDPCVNLQVGAYILALSMSRHGNTWQAIGAYHSATPERRDRYAAEIFQRLHRLGLVEPGSAR